MKTSSMSNSTGTGPSPEPAPSPEPGPSPEPALTRTYNIRQNLHLRPSLHLHQNLGLRQNLGPSPEPEPAPSLNLAEPEPARNPNFTGTWPSPKPGLHPRRYLGLPYARAWNLTLLAFGGSYGWLNFLWFRLFSQAKLTEKKAHTINKVQHQYLILHYEFIFMDVLVKISAIS